MAYTITIYSCPEYLRRLGKLIDGTAPLSPPLASPTSRRRVFLSEIQQVVAHHYGITQDVIWGSSRCRRHVRPRQVAMYLCRQFTELSMPEIGRRFGGRDHTTVLHALKTIERIRYADEEIGYDVNVLTKFLEHRAAGNVIQ